MKNKIQNKYFELVFLIVKWLQVCGNKPGYNLFHLKAILDKIQRVQKTRGTSSAIAFTKAVRGNLLNYLSGNKIKLPNVRLRSSGLPSVLGPLAEKIENNELTPMGLKFLMTILFSTRGLKTPPVEDTKSITDQVKTCSPYAFSSYTREF